MASWAVKMNKTLRKRWLYDTRIFYNFYGGDVVDELYFRNMGGEREYSLEHEIFLDVLNFIPVLRLHRPILRRSTLGCRNTGNSVCAVRTYLFVGKEKSVIPFILAGIMLYGPYAWCFIRKEPTEGYGLSWTLDRKGLKETLLAITLTLAPLTPLAMRWPGNDLPRSLPSNTVLTLLAAGAVAAVVEEVFFRGWIQTLLSKRTNSNISIVATALLFAMAHLFLKLHWLRFATFFPGLVMGILRDRHRSVAPSTIYHFAGNIWSIWFFPDIPI
jgi:hypothetical protein